jgi:hypothetical protein
MMRYLLNSIKYLIVFFIFLFPQYAFSGTVDNATLSPTNATPQTGQKQTITLNITSPLPDDTITRPNVLIKGTVTNTAHLDTGVTVNGRSAIIYNGIFIVNHLPLENGVNIITATATDTAGHSSTISIPANVVIAKPYVMLESYPAEAGVSPLKTSYSVRREMPESAVNYQIDFQGNDSIDLENTSFENVSFTYKVEGIYYPTINVSDALGNVYSDNIAIVVWNQSQIDKLLRDKWKFMNKSLSSGDITAALSYIHSWNRLKYEDLFNVLLDQLPDIVATRKEFNFIHIDEHWAKYELVTSENGHTYSYEVTFSKDLDGIWRIQSF